MRYAWTMMVAAAMAAGCCARGHERNSDGAADRQPADMVGKQMEIVGRLQPSKDEGWYLVDQQNRPWVVNFARGVAVTTADTGKDLRVRGRLEVKVRQTLDRSGNPVDAKGNIVQGVPGKVTLYALEDAEIVGR